MEDGLIAAVRPGSEAITADTVVDAAGCLVIPGLVQAHVHLCQTLLRGLADDMDVIEWLRLRVWPLEQAHDHQSLRASAMLSVAEGVGIVTENLFSGRFRYVDELVRMGADIRTEGHHAVIRGVERLSGAPVRASDIRAGAALVVAGLAADGVTVVSDPHHIDRGYEDFTGKLSALGADVRRMRQIG